VTALGSGRILPVAVILSRHSDGYNRTPLVGQQWTQRWACYSALNLGTSDLRRVAVFALSLLLPFRLNGRSRAFSGKPGTDDAVFGPGD